MAKLRIKEADAERTIDLVDAVTSFGRAPENKVILQDRESSRRHFQIERTEQGYKLVDLESRNGTRVNDRVVNQHLLAPGDVVQIGKTTLLFQADGAAPAPPPPAPSPVKEVPPSPPPASVRETEARRRSSGTTSIDKIRGVQRARADDPELEERKTLKIVGGIAAGFLGLIVILIVIGAVSRSRTDPPKPTPKNPSNPASDGKKDPPVEDKAEAALFGEIADLEKTLDVSHARALARCNEYLDQFPQGKNAAEVRRIRAAAESRRDASGANDLAKVRREAEEHRRNGRYADAVRVVSQALQDRKMARFNADLTNLKNEIVQEANLHYGTQIKKGLDLIDAREYEKARALLEGLRRELGGVPEFDAKLKAVEEALAKIR
ncbi:MAG: FHA domain-containing protein [Planctomycetes bacterium]|nr:FHA domain-containing protein [Planctomycetota bacterium]